MRKINNAIHMSNFSKGLALFVGGAVVGAAVAMLLTPKRGEEVRQELADLADEAKKRAQGYCEKVKQDLAQAEAKVAEQIKEA